MAGFLRIITQAVLTATPRKRPPLGLLVIAKLTLTKKTPNLRQPYKISVTAKTQKNNVGGLLPPPIAKSRDLPFARLFNAVLDCEHRGKRRAQQHHFINLDCCLLLKNTTIISSNVITPQ